MIRVEIKGHPLKDGEFDTDDINVVIDAMQSRMQELHPIVFTSRDLWKVSNDGKKLYHNTMVSYIEADIIRY